MATDWSPDYCLVCDRQTGGEAYCSQVCRLADLENATGSEPASPPPTRPSTAWTPIGRSPVTGFYLPPAFDFAAYRSSSSPPTMMSPRPLGATNSSTVGGGSSRTDSQATTSPRVLTPSSSRLSLTSVSSTSGPRGGGGGEVISMQARSELQDYTNSFDQVRHWRRRWTAT